MTTDSNTLTHATFSFLHGLRAHNEKVWFESHKADYREQVLQPLQALAAELGPLVRSIDPEIETTPAKVVSRVFRDTRFSRDKSPYKTSHWITFKRPRKEWQNDPAFFFEVSPDAWRYGMGFFSADRATMDRFRARVDAQPAAFLASVAFYPGQAEFVIEGEEYKRPQKADIPAELQPWYNRKSFYLVCNRSADVIDGDLTAEVTRGFMTLAPLYHYLAGMPDPA